MAPVRCRPVWGEFKGQSSRPAAIARRVQVGYPSIYVSRNPDATLRSHRDQDRRDSAQRLDSAGREIRFDLSSYS